MPSDSPDGVPIGAASPLRPGYPAEARLSDTFFRGILDRLNVAVFVFRGARFIYRNDAAERLGTRLRARFAVELSVMLRDQLARLNLPSAVPGGQLTALLTTEQGEPLHVSVIPLEGDCTAISVRELGTNLDAFRLRYGLSEREAQVAELVLRGYRNRDVAATLGITLETAKKHLSRIFDKVGVDSRVQLANRLA
jgi:DNA-binding CsgD family transcriptional regulator